jgi:hypothetical protein
MTSLQKAAARRSNGVPQMLDEDSLYTRNFRALSVRDLLDARDEYHVHLAHKANVIATAIGLYLIREDDPDAKDHTKTPDAAKKRGKYTARTLTNSAVRHWSWPCVLVFVSDWKKEVDMARPEQVVPPFLYLKDGRIVPVCVVEARATKVAPASVPPSRLEVDVLRGGSPIYAMAQGQRRVGSVGCIVTDGTDYFALTNHHVAGEPGRPIQASFRGVGQTVGESATGYEIRTRSFSQVYPKLPGREVRVNLDAGLVHLSNIWQWDTGITEVGPLGPMYDFSADTASLNWIGSPVEAYGAVSGHLAGEIRALFYRYATIGGREYVTDFLIGPPTASDGEEADGDAKPGLTRPGDSGTLWCMKDPAYPGTVRPLALEWGGQKLASDPHGMVLTQFALASSISVICRELEVDIVTSFTEERVPYWGAVGHFKIAQQACFHVKDQTLRRFLQNNLNNISFSDDTKLQKATSLKADAFVPLSDVPDIVWKTNVNKVKPQVARHDENPNHYADMDLPGADGRTLFQICGEPAQLDLDAWKAHYAGVSAPRHSPPGRNGGAPRVEQGCLPFRVWQVFSQLQGFAARGDVKSFLCAAGIIAHYVGDACQPLHSSQHSDGLEGARTGVHSTYEDNMVEAHAEQIATGVDQLLSSGDLALLPITSGQEAGMAAVELMRRSQTALPPETICRSYDRVHPGTKSPTKRPEVLDALWADCGTGTIQCIADGIRVLASLWEAAFASAADKSPFEGAQKSADLMAVYEDQKFLPSLHLSGFTAADLPQGRTNGAGRRNGTSPRAPASRGGRHAARP